MPARSLTLLILGCAPGDRFLPFFAERLGAEHRVVGANAGDFVVDGERLTFPGCDLDAVDCAIIRDPGAAGEWRTWQRLAEQVRFLNGVEDALAAADKAAMYARLDGAGVPVPEYLLLARPEEAQLLAGRIDPPYVIKDPRLEAGIGVLKVETARQVEDLLDYLWEIDRSRFPFVAQRLVAVAGDRAVDFRLILIGDRLLAAARRTGAGSFKTNVAQGAITEPFEPGPRTVQLARDALAAVGLTYGAVDLIRSASGEELVLEVNASPGALDLYLERLGVDLPAEIARFVAGADLG